MTGFFFNLAPNVFFAIRGRRKNWFVSSVLWCYFYFTYKSLKFQFWNQTSLGSFNRYVTLGGEEGVVDFVIKRYGNCGKGEGFQVIPLCNAGKKFHTSQCCRCLLHNARVSLQKMTLLCLYQAAERIHRIVRALRTYE